MTAVGFLATIEAKPGQEEAVAQFLREIKPLIDEETGTRTWNAFRVGPTTFGIFDTFDDETGRQAHLDGDVRAAIEARSDELFAVPLTAVPVDVLAVKPS